MFQTLLIAFREGLEALLVVAIATLHLRRTGRHGLISAIRAGLAVAVVLSLMLSFALSPTAEGVTALIPGIDNAYWHAATEDLVEGMLAQFISLALVIVPTLGLAVTHWQDGRRATIMASQGGA